MNNPNNTQVLVTGGAGFLGAHCILQLLQQGYQVRATLRSLKRKDDLLQKLQQGGTSAVENLSFVEADLTQDKQWNTAVAGCDYVLHVASPFPIKMPKDENQLIQPAVEGTLRVLRAARDAKVKRVVVTSSFAAVGYGARTHNDAPLTEHDWTDPDGKGLSAYAKSKTLAEKAAWDFIQREGGDLELAVICPRFVLGPQLGSDFSSSLQAIKKLLDGEMKAVPDISYGIVDVRDVADMHLRAMVNPAARNQRFIASSGQPMTFSEIALFLRKQLGRQASNVPTRVVPNWLVRVFALFNDEARGVLQVLGKRLESDDSKATRLLGWTPRSREAAILAAAECVIDSKPQAY